MFESPEAVLDELDAGSRRLRSLAAADREAVVEPEDQLRIENAIAAGVAALAGEPMPSADAEPSGRPILARDLTITAELVARAMRTHGTD